MQHDLLHARIMDEFKGMRLSDITGEHIRHFIDKLRFDVVVPNARIENGKLSASSIHKHFKLLNHLLSKAVDWRFLSKNPCTDIPHDEWPKPDYHHYPVWEEDDLKKFLQIIEELPNYPHNLKHKTMFYLALLTGARKSELIALTWEDIDWKNNLIHINKAQKYVNSRQVEISAPKTKEYVRSVYMWTNM